MANAKIEQRIEQLKGRAKPALAWVEATPRRTWGVVLILAAVASILGAVVMEAMGLESAGVKPLPFVSTIIALKLALFAFWPFMSRRGKDASQALSDAVAELSESSPESKKEKSRSIALWDQNDPRVDVALFSGNVPTFVLNHEQRFLDWNPAFDLIFGKLDGIKKGVHVSAWFGHLDNFRRVSKRQEKLFGEGILPIADRERATFLSKEYGRMVFTKIMTPIVDRRTGKILGWTVVLNLNSAAKRNEFLEALYSHLSGETKRIRHAAAYDRVLADFAGLKRLDAMHVAMCGPGRSLVAFAGSGELPLALHRAGHRVTSVESDTHLLRHHRDKCEATSAAIKLVKQDPNEFKNLPAERFDTAHVPHASHALRDPEAVFKAIFGALKVGGALVVSGIAAGGDVAQVLGAAREELEKSGRFDELKHQYNCVLDHQTALPYTYYGVEDLRSALLAAGFVIETERRGLVNGHSALLVARKR